MDTKKPWKSRMAVLNGVVGLVSFVSLFWSGLDFIPQFIAEHPQEIGIGWGALNFALRLVTKDKISLVD